MAFAAGGELTGQLHLKAAEQYLRSGHMDDGFAALARGLAPLGLSLPRTRPQALASLIMRRAHLRLRGLRYRERAPSDIPDAELARIAACYSVAASLVAADNVLGADFQTRNLLWALDAGDPYRIARAFAVEASYAAIRGIPGRARAEQLLGLAERLAVRIGHPHALGLVDGFRGVLGLSIGDWQSAREHCKRAQSTLRERCLGVAWELDAIELVHLWVVLNQGELAELARRVPPLLHDAEERGDRFLATSVRTSIVPFLSLAADQPMEARYEGARAAHEWSSTGFHKPHFDFLFYDAQIDLYLGEAKNARARIARSWPAVRASMLTKNQSVRIVAFDVRARCAIAAASTAHGQAREGMLRDAERDMRRVRREIAPWSRGWADLLAAGIAAVRGHHEAAAALARDAVRHCEAADTRLFAAAARRCLGDLLRGDEGRQLIAAADAWMTGQGIRNPARMTAILAPGFPGG